MGNIDTYVQTNANDTVRERALAPVDEMVLSYLVYYEFGGIVPSLKSGGSIALREAAALYKEKHGDSQTNVNAPFLAHIAASPRFADARLSGYEELFRKGRAQFAALRISFGEDASFIAFRGVDNSYTGWQEAFRASYSPSPAQRLAASYLNRQLRDAGKKVIVGGHSKGGNMALYAACACEAAAREQIKRIVLFDSPGLAPGQFSEENYRSVADRVARYVPQYSLIGRLFTKEAPDAIVASEVTGLLQHEPLYWKVDGRAFETVDEPDKKSERDARLLNRWIETTTAEERKSFTADLFRILRAWRDEQKKKGTAGETTAPRTESRQSRLALFRFVLRSYRSASRPSRRAARRLLGAIIASKLKGNR